MEKREFWYCKKNDFNVGKMFILRKVDFRIEENSNRTKVVIVLGKR